jgi:hypothetical protein
VLAVYFKERTPLSEEPGIITYFRSVLSASCVFQRKDNSFGWVVCPTALISIISILRGIGDSKADVCPFFEKHESVENISELSLFTSSIMLRLNEG